MKKLRERLNKKGFTLVELIVVIVIILILAAALVPNVMRYIGQAREASFKSNAATYLVEIQGYEAECFAKHDVDLNVEAADGKTYQVGKEGTSGDTITYGLSGFGDDDSATAAYSGSEAKGDAGKKTITYTATDGAITQYSFSDGKYYVHWTQTHGWYDVNQPTS